MLFFNSTDYNKVIITGKLGRDPESRVTTNGHDVASFSIASNKRQKKGEEWVAVTQWTNMVVWGKMVANLTEYVHKGDRVLVEGELQTRDYEDKDGNKRYSTEVVVDNLYLISSTGAKAAVVEGAASEVAEDDDIPF